MGGLLVAVALLGAVAAACTPPPPDGSPPEMSATPGLFPDWQPLVSDYVVRCDNQPVHFTVNSPSDITVSVNGSEPATGSFAVDVPLTVGQRFMVQTTGAENGTYSIRCIPSDFPAPTVTGSGPTQAEYYIAAPANLGGGPTYPAIYDSHGVPIWWAPATATAFVELLDNGDVAWTDSTGGPAVERTLSGTPVRKIGTNTVADSPPDPLPPTATDLHDLLRLANGDFAGDYLVVGNYKRTGGDFSSWTSPPADTAVFDHILEVIDPATGHVVWSWDVYDHIGVDQTDPQWRNVPTTALGYDAYHWNSVEETPTDFIVSFRHLDAVYAINRSTGAIDWKLGGTPLVEGVVNKSFDVPNDPAFTGASTFGGQHDARVNPDGTVSLYDDGTGLGRAPRAVRYAIDTGHMTATLVESVSNAGVAPSSFCCGSARRLPGGHWVIGWGGRDNFSEVDASGNEVFGMQFPGTLIYRALPVLPGVLNRDALRADMDQMATTLGASTQEVPSGPIQMP